MRHKFKQFGYYLIIIVLLPYVITVFINGPSITTSSHVDGTYVKVKLDENQMAEDSGGEGNVIELPIEDYCIGIIAKEVLPEYEKEMLKAQAVLVRTDVYRRIEQEGSDTVLNEPFWTQKQMEKAWGVTKYSRYYNKLRNAWRDTEGQVLMYEGKLAKTPFFRLSNGSTREPDFEKLDLKEQCLLLVEFTKILTCGPETANLLAFVPKAGTVGKGKFNDDTYRYSSALLINQSPTGLYEERIDLKTVQPKE